MTLVDLTTNIDQVPIFPLNKSRAFQRAILLFALLVCKLDKIGIEIPTSEFTNWNVNLSRFFEPRKLDDIPIYLQNFERFLTLCLKIWTKY